ncbi:hypothetical protein BC332_11924 [Capsicum chinense]|nr:hypothetical protein BC332_11924 [Capsicum chinense]
MKALLPSSSQIPPWLITRRHLCTCSTSDSGPSANVVFNGLVNCGKAIDFELKNPHVFNFLINSCVKAGRLNDAIDCFNGILERGIMPCVPIVNKLLKTLVRQDMIGVARDLYTDVVSRGIDSYDCGTVRILMSACVREGKMEESVKLFEEGRLSLMQDCIDFVFTLLVKSRI